MPALCVVQLASPLSFRESLEGRSHGSLLREFLRVQGFSEGWCLIGIGGYYGSTVGNGVGCSSSVAWGWVQVLPSE